MTLVKLLDLIPRHVDTNRMTLHALMVSLGPSLKVGNGVLSELLKHRLQLFAKSPTRGNAVTDLIDFGPVSIEPPSLGPVATVSLKDSPPAETINSEDDGSRRKKPPRLNSKPSLNRLFTSSSRNLAQFPDARPTTPLVDVEPPRVDLTLAQTSTDIRINPQSIHGRSESTFSPTACRDYVDFHRGFRETRIGRRSLSNWNSPRTNPSPVVVRYPYCGFVSAQDPTGTTS
jgi:hypothetical protein